MNPYEIIKAKRDGQELDGDAIRRFVQGFTRGEIPDYQAAAWLMAVYFRGMTDRETTDLTLAMVDSGATLDLTGIGGPVVDKHSTGGVGDKTTLVLGPLVAACGLKLLKLSGRGLGHTGGTLDKLEAIPGFRTALDREALVAVVNRAGMAVAGQTADLVPADGKLYALRDVTATVDSVPLIASSIMSKKLAAGAPSIVLDVKTGSGAFVPDLEGARNLARAMVAIGRRAGRRVEAVISDMDQPLGLAAGNALEVAEAIACLAGQGPEDLQELCLTLGSRLMVLAGAAPTHTEARGRLEEAVRSGRALQAFRTFVEAQGGDPRAVDDPARLPRAPIRLAVPAPAGGTVHRLDALAVGQACVVLGAGRRKKGDPVDLAVGVVLHKKVGDPVRPGEPLATVHASHHERAEQAAARVAGAYRLAAGRAPRRPLIHDIVSDG